MDEKITGWLKETIDNHRNHFKTEQCSRLHTYTIKNEDGKELRVALTIEVISNR